MDKRNSKQKLTTIKKTAAIVIALAIFTLAILGTFSIAHAQDLNPPTTGRTSPNVTSTFGTNTTVHNNINNSNNNTTAGNINITK